MVVNAQAARNLPSTASIGVIGRVISSSMVPERRSSAHSRMPIAGTSTMNSQGWNRKKEPRSACPRWKKPPR
jgi:hypothetical protein